MRGPLFKSRRVYLFCPCNCIVSHWISAIYSHIQQLLRALLLIRPGFVVVEAVFVVDICPTYLICRHVISRCCRYCRAYLGNRPVIIVFLGLLICLVALIFAWHQCYWWCLMSLLASSSFFLLAFSFFIRRSHRIFVYLIFVIRYICRVFAVFIILLIYYSSCWCVYLLFITLFTIRDVYLFYLHYL